MHPILFKIPFIGFEVPTYGLFMALGLLSAAWIFAWLASRSGVDREDCFEALLTTMVVSLLSSKILGMFFQPHFPQSLKELVQVFIQTGGVWYIGFLTGVAFAAWRFPKIGLKGMYGLDCAAAAVAIGHGIGRLGCFFAGCCWGSSCELPWAVTFTSERAHQITGVPLNVPLHPTQLYESAAELALGGLLILMIVRGWARFTGQPGLTYLAVYALIRFSIELVRDDPRGSAGLFSTSQWIALTVFACVVPFYALGLWRGTLAWWRPRR